MRVRGRTRPSRAMSGMGMVFGCVFIGIGIFVVIPIFGIFGVFWTLIAVGMVVYNAINAFSRRGVAHEVFEIETDTQGLDRRGEQEDSVESRLRELDSLKRRGLVTDEEHAEQRKRILKDL